MIKRSSSSSILTSDMNNVGTANSKAESEDSLKTSDEEVDYPKDGEKFVNHSWSSTRVSKRYHKHIWKIEDFPTCMKLKPDSAPLKNNFVKDKKKVFLVLYPNGYEERNTISLYLQSRSKIICNFSEIELGILDKNAANACSTIFRKVTSLGSRFDIGVTCLINHDTIRTSPTILHDRSLYVFCNFTEITQFPSAIVDHSILLNVPMIAIPNCLLKENLHRLLREEKYADVSLLTEGRKFNCHRFMLAARSPVFAAMLKHGSSTANGRVMEIDCDLEASVLEDVLQFIYTGDVSSCFRHTGQILIAAEYYDLKTLKARCETELCRLITVENCLNSLLLADRHNSEVLKTSALWFFRKHFKSIMKTNEWNSMTENPQNIKLMSELITIISS